MKSLTRDMQHEVWDCLHAIGLHTGSIKECDSLSREIRYATGRKVSASTLYRMLNQNQQKVVPSNYSISTVQAFLEIIRHADYPWQRDGKSLGTRVYKTSALYTFVTQEFQRETSGFKDWFTSLPTEHWATGREQMIIGAAIAHVLLTTPSVQRSSWKYRLIETPQFRTFYTETYVDLNRPNAGYLNVLKHQFAAMNQAFSQVGTSPSQSAIESLVFNVSIQGLLWYLCDHPQELQRCRQYVTSDKGDALRRDLQHVGILPRIRFFCMEWLILPTSQNRKGLLAQIRVELKAFFERIVNPQLREFAYCILIDTLLLKQELEEAVLVLSDVPKPSTTFVQIEPTIQRMNTYRSLFDGHEDAGGMELQDSPYSIGANELIYSQLMILLAKRLKTDVPRLDEAKPLIQQSGLVRFQALLR